ncbi:MAG: right-handed parallel beta-helix repeat-containing protein [Eubacteriales bacterium]|nr:right-handed parallel beta-helix repeat-containing protein [Eubacteriales bacterium]
MKKILTVLITITILLSTTVTLAEGQSSTPPAASSGDPAAMAGGQAPGGTPGGQSSQPTDYTAVSEYTEDTALSGGEYASTGTDENAILVSAGTTTIDGATVTRTSSDSTGGDNSSFYGVGAAVLVTGGTAKITNSTITTDAAGGAGVFAYGDGVAYVSNSTITTEQGTSGGIHVAGGGTLYASNLTVETNGASAAAIRSDRGSGTMVVDGGTYTANGTGSPAIYCTADITVNDATLTANGSEALCLEGLNTVRLFNSSLTGNMPDQDQNDNTWTVILYQSMSGDSEVGEGRFEMTGGELISQNGGLFYTTNTQSEFVLSNVAITATDSSEYFLRCTGNSNQRGWGTAGANGASCKFTGINQEMNGNVIWDSISQLNLYVTQGSVLTGAVLDDETNAGDGGSGYCTLSVDTASSWVVTGDSTVTTLNNAGRVVDADGNTVTIAGMDGTLYVQGTSQYTVTVSQYATTCDLSEAGIASSWSDYAVEM